MTEWSTALLAWENILSWNGCFSLWCSCSSYGVLVSQMNDLNKAQVSADLSEPFSRTEGWKSRDCLMQLLMSLFLSMPCVLVCVRRFNIRTGNLEDESCGGCVEDCVSSLICPCCSISQVKSTQHASQRTSTHSFCVARPSVSSTDKCQTQMMNEIEKLREAKYELLRERELKIQVPGKTAANASIFQPILQRETSVFEQIVM
jgi:hypothetical protein